ncbi:hypothetical protein C789_4591 [Microcystis aeruginosa FACHB-905 = DIANCHI905]|nr:hypothetical protein C789_4591 [Microcystis aeruginosa FACHB-905 = DIANCHI905]
MSFVSLWFFLLKQLLLISWLVVENLVKGEQRKAGQNAAVKITKKPCH